MGSITDNYNQTVNQYLENIDSRTIEYAVDTVIEFVRYANREPKGLLDFHNGSKQPKEENYKYDVFEKAHAALSLDKWDRSKIGSGEICKYASDAIAFTDNLVNRHFAVPDFLNRLKDPDKQKRDKCEQALYEIYLGDDEEKAFNDAISCFGAKYPIIAFLFFIKDRDRFLPTSPDTFDSIFNSMGLSFKMSAKCGWNNYCEFIAIIKCAQDMLSKSGVCRHTVSLLDAHSAIWIMNYEEFKSWRKTIDDINIPMRPKNTIYKPDGTSDYVCARCNYQFIQTSRCPECGQLMKE
ncbi:MAG: hypothetical protein IKG03_07370 [Clostridiales bacterium]|nr:hypothetical protein [Clostridiales bacterium]